MLASIFTAIGDVATSEIAYVNAVTFAVVLAFAASGEWVAERSGTLNISLEGMMLAGAFGATLGYDRFENAPMAVLCAVVGGLLVAFVQAQMSHRLVANQFVVGLTLNILVLGLSSFLDSELEPTIERQGRNAIPLLSDIPFVGPSLFDRSWIFYLIFPLIPLCWWIVYRTRWGLELRAAGENPQSADVSGIHVNKRRRQGIYVAGITAGLSGAFLVLSVVGRFEDSIVGGRGFIALIAVIFGGWRLFGTVGGCLLFGTVLSFRLSLQALDYHVSGDLLAALPFLVTILAMSLFAKRVRPPAALAQPFIRGLK
jgi:simple sugar transport system permease protein